MKIFKKEGLIQKLIIALLVLLFFSTVLPNISYAAEEAGQGGKLLKPVVDLLLTLGDGVMGVMQKAVVGTSGHISLDIGGKGLLIKVLGILAAILVFVVIAVATAGIGAVVAGIGGIVGSVLTAIGSSTLVTMMITIGSLAAGASAYTAVTDVCAGKFLPDITILPTYSVSPQEIFEGRLLLFDINFFNPKQVWVDYTDADGNNHKAKIDEYNEYSAENAGNKINYYYYLDGTGHNTKEVRTSKQNTALELSTVISKWYYSIRNIALVVMMLILVYVGIRIMLCSVASEKSKYKKMLGDWVVSMCLIFVLHYIMVFAVNVNEDIVDIIGASTETKQQASVINLNKDMKNKKEFIKAVKDTGDGELNQFFNDASGKQVYDENGNKKSGTGDEAMFTWTTNLVGRIRMLCQLQDGSSEYVGYAIAYLVLVCYTVFFAFTYLKRVLYMAFLTIIAPLVAMTYSIDKISDGKAQAFNMWLKEYIFNLLIQPMHLLLYMVLISMAYDLAATNIIYTLVAIGFMIPAEKLIRKMFGFEKAGTPGILSGAAGAAIAMNGMQKLAHLAGHGPGAKGGNKPVGKLDKSNGNDPNELYSRSADSGYGFNSLSESISNENSPDGSERDNTIDEGDGNPPHDPIDGRDGHQPLPPTGEGDDPIDLSDYEDIRLAEENANSLDFLNDEERKEYNIAKERANTTKDLSDYANVSAIEAKAAQRKTAHFQQERLNRRMLEESRRRQQEAARRQQEAQAEAARRQQEQAKSQTRMATFKRVTSKGLKNAISKENIGNAIETSVKTGTKFMGTATGAIAGATLGIATGDIGKVGQNAALGATAGGSLGAALGNGVVGGVTSGVDKYKQSKTEYEKERYGEEYSQHLKDEQDEQFKKDKEARKFYEREYSSELVGLTGNAKKDKLDKIMDDAIEYRKYGVTDNKLIVKAMKLDRSNRTSSESKLAAVMASKAKDYKGIEPYQKRLAKQVGNEKAEKIANNAAKLGGFI